MQIISIVIQSAFQSNTHPGTDFHHPPGGGFGNTAGTFVMFFGDHQNMAEVDGRNIQKRKNQFVFVNFDRRNFTGNDLAENTARHNYVLLTTVD